MMCNFKQCILVDQDSVLFNTRYQQATKGYSVLYFMRIHFVLFC